MVKNTKLYRLIEPVGIELRGHSIVLPPMMIVEIIGKKRGRWGIIVASCNGIEFPCRKNNLKEIL